MPTGQPDLGDVHANTLLTEILIGYEPGGFIADDIFPIVGVDKQTDIYPVMQKSFFARDDGAPKAESSANKLLRAPGTNAATTGFQTDITNTFRCDNFAVGIELADELIANADAVFDLEATAAQICDTLIRLRRDRAFVNDFVKTGVWKTDQTKTADFSNYGTSTPIEDLRTALRTVRRQSLATMGGSFCVTMGALVWDRLADHPDLLDRIKYTREAVVGPDLLASVLTTSLQIPVEVHIGNSVYTNDEEGTAESSVTYSDVFGGDILVTWKPDRPGKLVPSSGYTFAWRPMTGGGNAVQYARRIREDRPRKTIVEVHSYWDQVSVLTDTGVTLIGAAT